MDNKRGSSASATSSAFSHGKSSQSSAAPDILEEDFFSNTQSLSTLDEEMVASAIAPPIQIEYSRYGFQLTDRDEIATQQLEDVKREVQRLEKWQAMCDRWDVFTTKRLDKLKSRTWKGIPDRYRGMVWKLQSSPGMKSRKYLSLIGQSIEPRVEKLIRDDILRTFPTHEMFSRTEDGHTAPSGPTRLHAILHAYAALDPGVGYVQGMSFLAAVPLIYLTEEDAFWVFVHVMQRVGYREYFTSDTPQLQRSTEILQHLVKMHLGPLHARLEESEVTMVNFVAPWFLTVFLRPLPFPVALRFWDCLVICGHDALIAAALAILKLSKDRLLQLPQDKLTEAVMLMANEVELNAAAFMREATSIYKHLERDITQFTSARPELRLDHAAMQARWQTVVE